MNRDRRQRRMLECLPLLLQDGANIGAFFGGLADVFSGPPPVGGVEYGLTRLLRSRWHREAQGWTDAGLAPTSELGQLGVLFGFPPARGERVDAYRRRIVEFIAIHREGLTTAAALLRLVALVYQADAKPTIARRPSSGATAADFFITSGGERAPIHVELHDNPVLPASTRYRDAAPGAPLLLRNAGLDVTHPEVKLTPLERPAKVPVLTDLATNLRLIYVGVVPAQATLTLRHGRAPLIDGAPQDAPVLLLNPFAFDRPGSAFSGIGDLQGCFSVARRDLAMTPLAPGENRWRYDVLARDALRGLLVSWPELAALEELADAEADAPAIDIDIEWVESTPAAIALRIPADRLPDPFADDLDGFLHELEWALAYGSAAGVRARIELTIPHVREHIDLGERLHASASTHFSESADVDDPPGPPRQVTRLADALDGPADALSFSGHFNTTPFNASLFV